MQMKGPQEGGPKGNSRKGGSKGDRGSKGTGQQCNTNGKRRWTSSEKTKGPKG